MTFVYKRQIDMCFKSNHIPKNKCYENTKLKLKILYCGYIKVVNVENSRFIKKKYICIIK